MADMSCHDLPPSVGYLEGAMMGWDTKASEQLEKEKLRKASEEEKNDERHAEEKRKAAEVYSRATRMLGGG